MANIITIIRIIGIFPLVVSLLNSGPTFINFLIFVFISITDFLDGYIARKYNQITNFGKVADGVADKLLMVGVTISLLYNGTIPYWTLLIFIREILALLYACIYIRTKNKYIESNIYGKVKTNLHMYSIGFVLLFGYWNMLSAILLIGAIILIIPEGIYAVNYFKKS